MSSFDRFDELGHPLHFGLGKASRYLKVLDISFHSTKAAGYVSGGETAENKSAQKAHLRLQSDLLLACGPFCQFCPIPAPKLLALMGTPNRPTRCRRL